jgi:peptidase E
MSGFFDSEIVRKSLKELDDLQEKIINQLYYLPFADKEKKREHLETMKEFLEKQKLFIFRMTLSNDPEAVEMKEKIIESARLFGFQPGDNLNKFFDDMQETIDRLEETLDV